MLQYGKIIEKLSIDEKLFILTDGSFLAGLSAEKADVPYMSMAKLTDFNDADGYLRYPSFDALANAWDLKSAYAVAEGLSARAREAGANTALLPQANLRTNVYVDGATEDPCLMGLLTREYIKGAESVGVKPILTACAMREADCEYADIQPNPRAILGYYLNAFRIAVSGRGDVTVATNYERLKGEYEKVNTELVSAFIKKHFTEADGFAVNEKTSAASAIDTLKAGYSLSLKGNATALKEAVNYYLSLNEAIESGLATAETMETALRDGYAIRPQMIDEAVDEVLAYAYKTQKQAEAKTQEFNDLLSAQETARAQEDYTDIVSETQIPDRGISRKEMLAIAEKTAVLLKNEKGVLPLKRHNRVAVIGELGEETAPYVEKFAGRTYVGYSAGYDLNRPRSDERIKEAESLAKKTDIILLFLGFGESREKNLSATKCLQLPGSQIRLIETLSALGKKIVAVVCGSGRVDMRFDSVAESVMYAPDMGSCMGEALARLLYGESNPSGKLAFTMYDAPEQRAKREKFYKDKGYNQVGAFVGYRRYTSDNEKVKYPFGYGLSYTKFRYLECTAHMDGVWITIKNVGNRAGEEIVQFYAGKLSSAIARPKAELLDFERVYLEPGESVTIFKEIRPSRLAVYDEKEEKWKIEQGWYRIYASSSSDKEQIRCQCNLAGVSFENEKERLSDYLQSRSNIAFGGYFMDTNTKKTQHKATGLVLGIIAIVAAVLYDVFSLVFSSKIEFFRNDIGQITNLILFIVFNFLAILGIVSIILWAKRRKLVRAEEENSQLKRDERVEEQAVAPVSYARLFVEEFGEEEEEIAVEEEEEEEKEICLVIPEEVDNYHKNGWKFTDMCNELIAFASERGVLIDMAQARTILSAMNVSRLVVLKFEKGVNTVAFLQMLSAFFASDWYADNAKKYATADDMLVRKTADGYVFTNFARALDGAAADHFAVKLAHLAYVDLSAVGGYFTQLMRYVVKPETPYVLSLRNKTISDKTYTTTPNLWIFLTLNEEETAENIPAYIAETAAFVKVQYVAQAESTNRTSRAPVSVAQFLKFGDKSRNNFELDEGKWKKVDRLEEYVSARADYRLSNKLWQKMERYASCYLALGGEPDSALDSVVAVKMLTTILNLIKHNKKEDDEKFVYALGNILGEDAISACQAVIDISSVDVEAGWQAESAPAQAETQPETQDFPVQSVSEESFALVQAEEVKAENPVTDSAPAEMQPTSEPVTETVAEPVSEPVTETVAEPASEPIAETVAEPTSEPVAETVAEPEKTVEEPAQPVVQATQPVAETAQEETENLEDFVVDLDELDVSGEGEN